MAFIHGDRFLNSMDEAMLTAGIDAFSSVFVLVEPAATNTEKNSGALSSSSFLCSSNEKLSILSFEGDCKMFGFSLSTVQHILCQCPFEHEKTSCLRKCTFLHTAFAICLYVSQTSIVPNDCSAVP